jgi:hypothetical protein
MVCAKQNSVRGSSETWRREPSRLRGRIMTEASLSKKLGVLAEELRALRENRDEEAAKRFTSSLPYMSDPEVGQTTALFTTRKKRTLSEEEPT